MGGLASRPNRSLQVAGCAAAPHLPGNMCLPCSCLPFLQVNASNIKHILPEVFSEVRFGATAVVVCSPG